MLEKFFWVLIDLICEEFKLGPYAQPQVEIYHTNAPQNIAAVPNRHTGSYAQVIED